MRIFLTGATGFLGKVLSKDLKDQGHELVLLVRDLKKLGSIHRNMVIIEGDLNTDITKQLDGVDIVIHNASKTPGADFLAARNQEMKKEFYEINTEGTKNIINACKQKGIKRLIYISSHAVSNSIQNADYYTKSKEKAEHLVEKSGLDWTILRPTGIYGINNYWIDLLKSYNKKKIFLFPGNGKILVDYIYVDDLSNIICKLLSNDSIKRKYLVRGEVSSKYLFLKQIKKEFKFKFIIINIPLKMVSIFVYVFRIFNPSLIWKYDNIRNNYYNESTQNIDEFEIVEGYNNHKINLKQMNIRFKNRI